MSKVQREMYIYGDVNGLTVSEQIVIKIVVQFVLVYLFIHSVTHVTLDMSITDYNLYIIT
jgi:hypothetical protein